MFPIGDDNVSGAGPSISTWGLLIANVNVFFFEATRTTGALERLVAVYGVSPREIAAGVDLHPLLTSMFLHAGWLHLIGNLLFLWVFSINIVAVLGTPLHFAFYMAGGLESLLAHVMSNPVSSLPSVGASGAITAILGAFILLLPQSRVRLLIFAGYTMGVTRASALVFLVLWAVMQLFSGVASLGLPTAETGGVAWWAHIGEFAFGLLVGGLAKRRVRRSIVINT